MKFLIPLVDIPQVKIFESALILHRVRHAFPSLCECRLASLGGFSTASHARRCSVNCQQVSLFNSFFVLLIWAELTRPHHSISSIGQVRFYYFFQFEPSRNHVLVRKVNLFHCSTSTYLSERVYLRVCRSRLQILQLLQWEGGLIVWAFLIFC